MLVACKSDKQATPADKKPDAQVDAQRQQLLTAVCLLTLVPPGPSSGSSSAAVIDLGGGKTAPWIIRSYQHLTLAEVETALRVFDANNNLIESQFPTSLCKVSGPIFATFRLGNPGEPTTVIAGRLGKLVKETVPGTLEDASMKRGVELVLAAAKEDGANAPALVWYDIGNNTKDTGIDGRTLEMFRAAGGR